MEEDYISISTLNDFIFCPYSIYLHNVYMESDTSMFHAAPQTTGRIAHRTIDTKKANNRADVLLSLPVYSERYHLMGKIDVFNKKTKRLIERKYRLEKIFQGQIYQLWAQMFCLREMGYEVESLAFYEISTNKMIPIDLPNDEETKSFSRFVYEFQNFIPSDEFSVNPNKCRHCIYCNLCDKTEDDNVYT